MPQQRGIEAIYRWPVFTRPEDLPEARVIAALAKGWGLYATDVTYTPVGFGSYHWVATAAGQRWFITVDDLVRKRRQRNEPLDQPRRRLAAALSTARSLRDSGYGFVLAPRPTNSGDVIHDVDDRFVVALYPYVDGEIHEWGPYPSRKDRLAVLDLIAMLHTAPPSARPAALGDHHVIPHRDQLASALDDRDRRWESGPFGEPTRLLINEQAATLFGALDHYDRLAAIVADQPERMVLTHGEPHRANTITTPSGVLIIDWDTALIAPPERDLWSLVDEDATALDDYTLISGTRLNPDALDLYRLWWDLAEVAGYTAQFREPHRENEDTRAAWENLVGYLHAVHRRAEL